MKTLSSSKDLAEVCRRIAEIAESDPGHWGVMSAPQMLCHLRDAFSCPLGGRMPSPIQASSIPLPLFKWLALRFPRRWPVGVRTPPEIDQLIGGTPPRDFESDRADLLRIVNEFAQATGPWEPHPLFRNLTTAEWMRWGYLHADHHLRQFGR